MRLPSTGLPRSSRGTIGPTPGPSGSYQVAVYPVSGSVSSFTFTSHRTQRPSTIGTVHRDFIEPDSHPLPALLRVAPAVATRVPGRPRHDAERRRATRPELLQLHQQAPVARERHGRAVLREG